MGIRVFFLGIVLGIQAIAAPTFGRYVGVLKHEQLQKEQLAKLDFIISRSSDNELELKAVLSLQFGDYRNDEYVSYHYSKVRYNILSGALSFTEVDQPMSIFVKGFSGGKFVGEVFSIWAGKVGELNLSSENAVTPTLPMIEPVWGQYNGQCGTQPVSMRIYTMRSSDDLSHLAQPFSANSIRAILSVDCKREQCVNLRFTSGSYNFLIPEKQLTLVGNRRAMSCDVDGDSLRCTTPDVVSPDHYDLTDCQLKRVSKETAEPRQYVPNKHEGSFSSVIDTMIPTDGFNRLKSGEYRGYVFHQNLGIYQAASINLNVFQAGAGDDGGTRISAFGRLFFGDHKSAEFIPYSFPEKLYPNPLAGGQQLVLERMDSNLDAVVQINEVKDGVIRGNWYSMTFGHVGPFEMRANEVAPLPSNATKMEALTGAYHGAYMAIPDLAGSQWKLRLQIVPGIKPPMVSENPFFPNFVRGSIILDPITPALAITDGSYDFYTGKFGFVKVQEEGPEHAFIGRQISRNQMALFHAGAAVLGPPPRFAPQNFNLVK